jgi:hypothetical protein
MAAARGTACRGAQTHRVRRRASWAVTGRATFGVLAAAALVLGARTVRAQDVGITRGIRMYTAGDARGAARTLYDRMHAGPLTFGDLLRARVYLAFSYLTLGDTTSARPIIRDAVAQEPCLQVSDRAAPPAWRALFDSARPRGVQCTLDARGLALTSLAVPGLGQIRNGRHASGTMYLMTTGVAVGLGVQRLGASRTAYRDYQVANTTSDARARYSDAAGARAQARLVFGAAAGVWGLSALDAYLSARRRNASTRAAANFAEAGNGSNPGAPETLGRGVLASVRPLIESAPGNVSLGGDVPAATATRLGLTVAF